MAERGQLGDDGFGPVAIVVVASVAVVVLNGHPPGDPSQADQVVQAAEPLLDALSFLAASCFGGMVTNSAVIWDFRERFALPGP